MGNFGAIADNRLVDGTFIDAENYGIERKLCFGSRFVADVVNESLNCLPEQMRDEYLNIIERNTGIRFTSMFNDLYEDPMTVVMNEIEAVMDKNKGK